MADQNPGIMADEKKAAWIARWRKSFERNYSFKPNYAPTESNEHMALFEALTEMGKHIGLTSSTANVSVEVGGNGVTRLVVQVTPRE